MKTTEDIKLKDTLPDSLTKDENISACAEALDPQLKKIAQNSDIPALYVNIDKLPSRALDHLAMQYDISVWRDNWPLNLKRSVLKNALSDKRKKGTKAAVIQALESIGSSASIVEWYQKTPKGEPHTFTVYATLSEMEGVFTDDQQEDLLGLIDDAKPLRSHYEFVLQTVLKGGIGTYGCLRVLTKSSVRSGF